MSEEQARGGGRAGSEEIDHVPAVAPGLGPWAMGLGSKPRLSVSILIRDWGLRLWPEAHDPRPGTRDLTGCALGIALLTRALLLHRNACSMRRASI